MASVAIPELPVFTMLARAMSPVILSTRVTFVIPPLRIVAGLTAVVMPVIFGTMVAFMVPPVRIITGNTVPPFVLFLALGALVAASVVPMVIITA